jgi:hypothetical protein
MSKVAGGLWLVGGIAGGVGSVLIAARLGVMETVDTYSSASIEGPQWESAYI